MKTQISNLRSGTKNQILNSKVNYLKLPKASSHIGHAGSRREEVESTWGLVKKENPISMNVEVMGVHIELKANWSLSGKSVSYFSNIGKDVLEGVFNITSSKKGTPWISIQNGNMVIVSNGKHSELYICPSLISIK